ncbi:MAG TPA: hypothetical protein VF469_36735 [Kofleriaceae bacterium]
MKAPAAPVAPAAPTPPTALLAAPIALAPVAAPAAPAPAAAPVNDPATAAEAQAVHDKVWSTVPSVTSDGSRIFVPFSVGDGARGEPNRVFDLWDRRGKRVQRVVVKTVDQCDGRSYEGCPPDSIAQVKAQELAAAKFLTELERKGLHPLQEAVDDYEKILGIDGAPARPRAHFTAGGAKAPSLTVELSETGVLTVQPRGHAAITRQSSVWRTRPSPEEARRLQALSDKGKEACFNPASLHAPLVDVVRRVAVVTISYRGNDACWEPNADYIVVTW